MSNYTLPYFGEIDASSLEDIYDTEIDFNNESVSLDLNFEDASIDTKKLDSIKRILEGLATYDEQNKKHIEQDYKNEDNDTVRTYVEHHIEEIDPMELLEVLDITEKTDTTETQLIKALHLVRVGFYPHSDEVFATFDYSLDPEVTDYLVVINTDENGKLVNMTMES